MDAHASHVIVAATKQVACPMLLRMCLPGAGGWQNPAAVAWLAVPLVESGAVALHTGSGK